MTYNRPLEATESKLSTTIDEVQQKRYEAKAEEWIADYRRYARKPDSLGHSDHSGEWLIDPRYDVSAEVLTRLADSRHEETRKLVPELREQHPHIGKALGEIEAKNFMHFFRARLTEIYFVSARRDSPEAKQQTQRALHKQPKEVQSQIAKTFAHEALEFTVFMSNQGAVLDVPTLNKMARHSPIVYLNVEELKDHYFDLLYDGHKESELRQKFFGSPRKTARNGRSKQYRSTYPLVGNRFGSSPTHKPDLSAVDGQSQGDKSPSRTANLRIIR